MPKEKPEVFLVRMPPALFDRFQKYIQMRAGNRVICDALETELDRLDSMPVINYLPRPTEDSAVIPVVRDITTIEVAANE